MILHLYKELCKRKAMKGSELSPIVADVSTPGEKRGEISRRQSSFAAQFVPVRDSRNRRVPGLCARNGRFYGVLWADRGDGRKTARRIPLLDDQGEPITTLTAAKEAVEILRGRRRENLLAAAGRKPSLDDFAATYLSMAQTALKRKATQGKESRALHMWRSHLGAARVDRITTAMIAAFVEKRLKGATLGGKEYKPASARTVNLDLIALRNCLKAAIDSGHLRELPRFPRVKQLPPERRPLLTPIEFNRLLETCLACRADQEPITKNGQQLQDFLRFLAYTGAREQEALCLKWIHVDIAGKRLFIGADEQFVATAMTVGEGGSTKNRGSRCLDFNPQLEQLMRETHSRRTPDSSWVFPSPQRGDKDIRAMTLRESFNLVRFAAGLPNVGFHDLRHMFCSFCVMAGVDFMTIAAWLGHKDGGILVGKVYGHLLDDHRKKAAARLTIGLSPVAAART
ncbi:MAG TPA: site-specific integrase [Terrimicrobiaceae bacterium]